MPGLFDCINCAKSCSTRFAFEVLSAGTPAMLFANIQIACVDVSVQFLLI